MQYGVFENRVLVPWNMAGQDFERVFKGPFAQVDDLPDYARHRRGERLADIATDEPTAQPQKLAGCYFYGGPLHPIFGHFIGECVHRLWLREQPEFQDLPVVFVRHEDASGIPGFFEPVLKALGVDNYLIINDVTELESLVIAEQGKWLQTPPQADYTAPLVCDLSAEALAGLPKKICLLRGHMQRGRLVGESWLEQQLEAEGYVSVRPEMLPFEQQLQYLMAAEKIIFSEGTTIHLVDLLPKLDADIVVLNRRPKSPLPQTSLENKCNSLYIFRSAEMVYMPKIDGFNRALSFAPMAQVLGFLSDAGFMDADAANQAADFDPMDDVKTYMSAHGDGTDILTPLMKMSANRMRRLRACQEN